MQNALRTVIFLCMMTAPILIGSIIFANVADTHYQNEMSIPSARFEQKKCNWYCHNKTCNHQTMLPNALTGDDGWYGAVIKVLADIGRYTDIGYAGANILVFCVAWPLITGALYTIAMWRMAWNLF